MKVRRAIAGLIGWLAVLACLAEPFDMTPFNPKVKPGLHSSARTEVCLNGIWKFNPIIETNYYTCDEFPDPDAPPEGGEYVDMIVPGVWKDRGTRAYGAGWSGCRLPDGSHLPTNWFNMSRAWYRRSFDVPEDWKGKAVVVRFDAVAFYGKVFVNGKPVGEHLGPGTAFELDISDDVKYGAANVLDVYVIDKRKGMRVPKGLSGYRSWGQTYWQILPEQWEYRREVAGIWKDVFLEARDKFFVDDIFAMPSYRNREMTGRVWVRNAGKEGRVGKLLLDILDMEGKEVLDVGECDMAVYPGETVMIELSEPWADPRLWDIDEPNMYYMRARLQDYSAAEQVIDEKFIRFGFREVWVEKDQIYLNGHIIHPLGDWDTRMNIDNPMANQRYEVARERLRAMREEAGFLAPRMTWITPWNDFYDAADDLGFPIIATGYAGTTFDHDAWPNFCREWREAIRDKRNHPSIILWSCENEGVSHSKATTVYMLQRRLDQILEEMDPTRPYYHDGHCRFVPEDLGGMYENGDLCGTAPISGGHYTRKSSPMSIWMHEFDDWRKEKPFIYGEAGTFDYRDIETYTECFYGEQALGTEPTKTFDKLGGKVTKMVLGSWRTYAVSGIMPLGVFQSWRGVFRNRGGSDTALTWNDFETPGAKPWTTMGVLKNPYDPGRGSYLSRYGEWVAKAFAPLLVSLQRDLRHNYGSGEKAAKDVWLVNDTRTDQKVKLSWTLSRLEDGSELEKGLEEVDVTQGRPVKRSIKLKLPAVRKAERLVLRAHAETVDGKLVAEDDQELSVYPEDPTPKLSKEFFVYGSGTDMADLTRKLGIKTKPFGEELFTGDASKRVLLVAPYAFDKEFLGSAEKLDGFLKAGGVIVVLNQNCSLPSTASSNAEENAPKHPVFNGLADSRVYFWNTPGNLIAECAVDLPLTGFYLQYLLEYERAHKFKSPYIFEMRNGSGALLGCNLLLAAGYDTEPEARLLLHNLLRYADGFNRENRKLYFQGSEATAIALRKYGLPVNGLSLTGGTEATAKEMKLLSITVDKKPVAEVPSLGRAVLVVEDMRWLGQGKTAVDEFVDKGGILVVLPQDNESWDKSFTVDGPAIEKAPDSNHLYKGTDDSMLDGVTSLRLNPAMMLTLNGAGPWKTAFHATGGRNVPTNLFGLAWKESGGGRMVFSQIPWMPVKVKGVEDDRGQKAFLSMLSNLGVEIDAVEPASYLAAFMKVKESFAEVVELTDDDRKKFDFLNLKFHMNAALGGDSHDIGILNAQYRKVPLGAWVFAGVPFYLVDADKDELLGGDPGAANSCIVLKGREMPVHPEKIEGIRIEGDKGVKITDKAKRIHFLQASCWAISRKDSLNEPNHVVVTYRINYKDGTHADVEARNDVNITDWWVKERNFDATCKKMSGAGLAWGERLVDMPYALGTMWVQSWDNPNPDKEIESMDIISAGKSVPILFAVTLEK